MTHPPSHERSRDELLDELVRMTNARDLLANTADRLIAERDVLREIIARAARLCEGRDTAMVLQVLREAEDV